MDVPSATSVNPYRFNGKRYDTASGSYDMGFRDYDPGLNRYTSRDMYNGALADMALGVDPWNINRYAFAGGNPVTGVELDGHLAATIDGGGGGSCGKACQAQLPEYDSSTGTVSDSDEPSTQSVYIAGYGNVEQQYVKNFDPCAQSTACNSGEVPKAVSYVGSLLFDPSACDDKAARCAAEIAMAFPLFKLGKIGKIGDDLYDVARGGEDVASTAANTGTRSSLPRDALGRFTSGAGGESAAAAAGRTAHANYANTLGGGNYVFNRALPGSRLRPDAVDYSQNIVRELKPGTPSGISRGWRQVNEYKAYLEELTGQPWTAYVDVYTP